MIRKLMGVLWILDLALVAAYGILENSFWNAFGATGAAFFLSFFGYASKDWWESRPLELWSLRWIGGGVYLLCWAAGAGFLLFWMTDRAAILPASIGLCSLLHEVFQQLSPCQSRGTFPPGRESSAPPLGFRPGSRSPWKAAASAFGTPGPGWRSWLLKQVACQPEARPVWFSAKRKM